MPHVVYLHSALTARRIRCRDDRERRAVLRYERWDVVAALGLAGLVNLAMLVAAAKVFDDPSRAAGGATIGQAYDGLARVAGGGAALAFAVALLASGISSSSVGTLAGQAIMDGFLKRGGPVLARRAVTIVPALAALATGVNPTEILIVSQVVLSFGIPFALVPLILVSRSRTVMGAFASGRATIAGIGLMTAVIIALNGVLLWQLFTG
jgi:manganese transport protein